MLPTDAIESLLRVSFTVLGVGLIALILVRRGEGGGLGGALGGGMGADSVLGVKAAKTLDKLIAWVAGIFLFVGTIQYTPLIREAGLNGINEPPTIEEFKVEPTTVKTGDTVKLTAFKVRDPDRDRVVVSFYQDDGDGRFNPLFDRVLFKVEEKDFDEEGSASRTTTFDKPKRSLLLFAVAEDNQKNNTGVSKPHRVTITVEGEAITSGSVGDAPGS